MKAIGGYPELELRKGEHYHKDAIRLNTARNCLEFILLTRKYTKVYLPYYTCDAVFEPFGKDSTGFPEMVFYHIDRNLDPVELPDLKDGEAFLYTNYFGLKQKTVGKLAKKYGNRLIADNSQAFFDMPYTGIDTFYSARKFFGVPDGAYLYTDMKIDGYQGLEMDVDRSFDRMNALLKRIDLSAEDGYDDFHIVEDSLCWQPIRMMSKLTESILSSVEYKKVRSVRRNNYFSLERELSQKQFFSFRLDSKSVPLCYPFFSKTVELRNLLIDNKIFVPLFWPNVLERCPVQSVEHKLTNNIIPLPIDQRYSEKDMERIIAVINSN